MIYLLYIKVFNHIHIFEKLYNIMIFFKNNELQYFRFIVKLFDLNICVIIY